MATDESAIYDMYIYQLLFSFMWLLISYILKLNTIAQHYIAMANTSISMSHAAIKE